MHEFNQYFVLCKTELKSKIWQKKYSAAAASISIQNFLGNLTWRAMQVSLRNSSYPYSCARKISLIYFHKTWILMKEDNSGAIFFELRTSVVYRENIAFVGRETSVERLNRFFFFLFVYVCVCVCICVSLCVCIIISPKCPLFRLWRKTAINPWFWIKQINLRYNKTSQMSLLCHTCMTI